VPKVCEEVSGSFVNKKSKAVFKGRLLKLFFGVQVSQVFVVHGILLVACGMSA